MLKGNKGEWTELYVLIKLLSEGKLYQSDEFLEKDLNNVYDVMKVFKNEINYEIEFVRGGDVEIYTNNSKTGTRLIGTKTIEELGLLTELMYSEIMNGKGKSFELPQSAKELDGTGITQVKAKSTSKSDIKIRIYDYRLSKETDLGFSIKSLMGSDSTLFNTGTGNNFIFQIKDFICDDIDKFNRDTYSKVTTKSKITTRINLVEEHGGKFEYKDIQSNQLWKNLKMIDGDLPEILGWSLYYRYKYKSSNLIEVCDLLEKHDPLNFYKKVKSEQKFYEHKIQRFLVESSLGMTSETPWDGIYESLGGVIITKKDGDVVCFHIYDFNLLKRYLLNNTRFEQPASGEDENNPGHIGTGKKKFYFGWLYREQNQLLLKMNLQIRFTSSKKRKPTPGT